MQVDRTHHDRGQGLVEFGLLLALVAVVAIFGLLIFGNTVSSMMSTLSHTVSANIAP
ncbi:MAG: Flp family type IVb pilin [Chloroflexi bacterium]|nr:Flp family type IVb pilin [Chloroflexota bacterium]MBV9897703.1 Flp family type IVb pilin [Chloroflexota bacterium]